MKIKTRWLFGPAWSLIATLAIYFFVDGGIALERLKLGLWEPAWALDSTILRSHAATLLVACASYGVWRVYGYHPAFHAKYRLWLTTTPWTAGMPLPMGPITLAWQDALLLCAVSVFGVFHAHVNPAYLVVSFAIGYVITSVVGLVMTGRDSAYPLALALAGVVRAIHSPGFSCGLALALCAAAAFSLQRSMTAFPWELESFSFKTEAALARRSNSLGQKPFSVGFLPCKGFFSACYVGHGCTS